MSGACFRRWREWRGRDPAGKRGPITGKALLILPVPLGIQPGTFGDVLGSCIHSVATVSQMQTPTATARPTASADVRRRPLPSVSGLGRDNVM